VQNEQAHQAAAWRRVRDRLEPEVGTDAYQNWLRHLELQKIVEAGLHATVIAPNHAIEFWATVQFADQLLVWWQAEDARLSRLTISALDDEFGRQMPDEAGLGCAAEPGHQNAWRRVLDRLRSEVGQDVFAWLRDLQLNRVERDDQVQVWLIAPTTFLRDWVTVHYADLLLALWQAQDRRVNRVTIVSPPLIMRGDQVDDPFGARPREMLRLAHGGKAEPAISKGTQRSAGARRTQRNRGGAPPRYDWEALWWGLIKIADIDGLRNRRELRQRARDWIAANWPDGGPSDSVLREKLTRLGDLLDLPET
jgi:chromosomal replication initiation ATPase DnaA